MTDFMLQAISRKDVLDDLADALPLETWIGPFSFDGGTEDIQHIYGGENVDNGAEKEWFMLIVWHDNYSSRVLGTSISRGLHANVRVVGVRGGEIAGLIETYIAKQTKAPRNIPEEVWRDRGKPNAGQVHKTARGTSWLQGDDPAGDGYVADQSFRFG